MKPIISLSWLSLFFALTLPNLQALPITSAVHPSGSSETQGKLATTLPSTTGSHLNLTQEQPKNESHGKNATNETAGETTTPTTTGLMTSRDRETTTAKSSTTQSADQSKTFTKATSPKKNATEKGPASSDRGGIGTAVKLTIIFLVLLIFIIFFRWLTRQTGPTGDATRRCSHGLQEQLRSAVRAIERCLGLSLWPRKRMENEEDAGEEEEMNGSNGTAGASKGQTGCQKGGEEEDEEEDDDEDQREEDEDSSDDYSSLEGVDLRERARQRQEESHGEKERESKTEGAEEDLTSITLGEENKEGAEEDDVTEL